MLKRLKSSRWTPAAVVTTVLAAAMLVPAANSFAIVVVPGCGYGYPAEGAPTVTDVNPNAGPPSGGTSVTITGTNYCTVNAVHFGANSASFVVNSRTQITATSPAGSAGSTVDVTVSNSFNSGTTSATSAADQFFYVNDRQVACSTQQYFLSNSNGVTWKSIDASNLSLGFTAAANGFAEFGANSDLWTENAGFNQDLGVTVLGGTAPKYPTTAGQPEAWKESGGFGGTRSPNAAFVHTVIPVVSGQHYAALLTWKTNKADTGTIVAGAGPIGGRFSQTCLTVRLFDGANPDSNITAVKSVQQYTLSGSNGTTWADMDATNLKIVFTAPNDGSIKIGANSDLWTGQAGFNQDIGISINGTVDAWKESGGFNGTRSPNAAFVNDVIPVAGDSTYTIKIVWKANKADSGQIHAGAGPSAPFSPTGLTVEFFVSGTEPLDQVSNLQYNLQGSDGKTWQAVDTFNFLATFTVPNSVAPGCTIWAEANADLWTGDAGFNQDIGIEVKNTIYPSFPSQPEGWKESGGFNGTRSPNAAFLQIAVPVSGGETLAFLLVWKANTADTGAIHIGAGPSAPFSPTRMTLYPVGC